MKTTLLALLICFLQLSAKAQVTDLTVNEIGPFTVYFVVYASDPGTCNNAYSSIMYAINWGITYKLNISSISWSGTTPPPGSSITAAMISDPCVAGSVVATVGDPCTGYPPTAPPYSICTYTYSATTWTLVSPSLSQLDLN